MVNLHYYELACEIAAKPAAGNRSVSLRANVAQKENSPLFYPYLY